MVVACIALIVALGGTGYAAIKLPRNSVGTAQIRANAVTGAKVRNGSLTSEDFRADGVPRGPRGPAGPEGATGPSGSQGPKGDPAPTTTVARVAFASRDPATAGGAIATSGAFADLIGLGVPAGTAGYTSSSGTITVSGPGRMVATADAVILNPQAGAGDASCRLMLVGSDTRIMGSALNAAVPGGGYTILAVTAGIDVEARGYDVRLQCAAAGMQFHRGGLTVTAAAR